MSHKRVMEIENALAEALERGDFEIVTDDGDRCL